jgi:hypothetical protein
VGLRGIKELLRDVSSAIGVKLGGGIGRTRDEVEAWKSSKSVGNGIWESLWVVVVWKKKISMF